jgi:hypothetical protein
VQRSPPGTTQPGWVTTRPPGCVQMWKRSVSIQSVCPSAPATTRLGSPPVCHDLDLGEVIDRLLELLYLQERTGDHQPSHTQPRARSRPSSHQLRPPIRCHPVELTAPEASDQPAAPATPCLTGPVRPVPRWPAPAGRWPAPCRPGRTPSVCCARRSRGNRPRSPPPRGPLLHADSRGG